MKSFKDILTEGRKPVDSNGKAIKLGDKVKVNAGMGNAGRVGIVIAILNQSSAFDSTSLRIVPTDNMGGVPKGSDAEIALQNKDWRSRELKLYSFIGNPSNQTTKVK